MVDIINYTDDEDPAVLIIDDPNTPGVRTKGIGRIRALDNGQIRLCVHDVDAPYGVQAALLVGDYGMIVKSVSVKVDEDTTIYYYLARF